MRGALAFTGAVVLLFLFILAPLVWSYIHTPPGMTWLPIVDSFHRCSDGVFYSAVVQEARDHFLKYANPVGESVGGLWIDVLRFSSTRLAAILTLGIADDRFAIIVSQLLCLVLISVLVYLVARYFLFSRSESSLCILLFMLGSYLSRGYGSYKIFFRLFFGLSPIVTPEHVSDFFRFAVPLASIPFSLFHLFTLLLLMNRPSIGLATLHGLSLFALSYAYIPSAAIGYAVSFFVLIYLYFHRTKEYWIGSLPFLVTFTFLLLADMPGLLHKISIFPNYIVTQAHLSSHGHKVPTALLLFLLIFGHLSRKARLPDSLKILNLGVIISVLTIFAVSLILGRTPTFERSYVRGFSILVHLTVVISLVCYLRAIVYRRKWAGASIFLAVILIAIFRLVAMTDLAERNHAYYVSDDFWKIRTFVIRNLESRGPIAALDATDMELLPVYSKAHLYFADPNYAHIEYDANLRRLLGTLKILNIPSHQVAIWVRQFSNQDFQFRCQSAVVFEPQDQQIITQLFRVLLYTYHAQKALGVAIKDNENTAVTPEFEKAIIDEFEAINRDEYTPDTIITNSRIEEARGGDAGKAPGGYSFLTQIGRRSIYLKNSSPPL